MVFSVHLQRSAVVAIVNCPVRGQFIGSRSLKPAARQSIWLLQESLITHSGNAKAMTESKCQSLLTLTMKEQDSNQLDGPSRGSGGGIEFAIIHSSVLRRSSSEWTSRQPLVSNGMMQFPIQSHGGCPFCPCSAEDLTAHIE